MTKQDVLRAAEREEMNLEASRDEAFRADQRDVRRLVLAIVVFVVIAAAMFVFVLWGGKGAR